ncbi:isoprenoid synthase domain-containing protein [Aspergillus multicolor]|uniref:bifunctional terpene synthase/polyprenyl synthetase family protein n=1 Tax=Aspergillus multicolor TaxID=41759 RepID=UPI003CCDC5CB
METLAQILRHCEPINYNDYDPLPADHFTTYPVFCSKGGAEATESSREFRANWKQAVQADRLHEEKLDFLACATHLGHYVQWAYPGCLPERVALAAVISDFAFFWDDVTDSIGIEQTAEITQDFGVAMLSELQPGRRIEAKFEINKLGLQIIRDSLAVDYETGVVHLKGWAGHLDAQVKSTHNNMSWEQYVQHRVTESGGGWGIELGCWTNNIRATPEEKASVQYLTRVACAGAILANDYYSFRKEFDEHHRSGTLGRMQNSVALLMREYGYTEQEARAIIKQEVQRREKEYMDGFDAWSKHHAGPESMETRNYLIMTLTCMSGSMFWMAHAARYHRTDLSTSAEDRASLIGKPHGALRVLEGHLPPKSMGSIQVPIKLEPLTTRNGDRRSHDQDTNRPADNIVSNGHSLPTVVEERKVSNGVHREKICDAPYEYIESLPSKKNRDKLLDAVNQWFQAPASSAQRIKNIVHMLHNSSLMLDDIEDASALRRGQPATHTFYGVSQTINSANYIYVSTVHEVTQLYNPKCLEIFIDELRNLHRGQSLDLYWRHHARCPTTEEYIVMADNKTGGLFRLMLRLVTAESLISRPLDPSLSRLLTLTGRYYQIRDDYLNLTSVDYESKKGFCEDFDEGKFSLPLIHLLTHTRHPDRITSALFNRAPGLNLPREVKQHILAAMEEARTLDYTRDVLKYLHEELMHALDEAEDRLGTNNGVRMILLGLGLSLSAY